MIKSNTNLILVISKQSRKLKENTVQAYQEKIIGCIKKEL